MGGGGGENRESGALTGVTGLPLPAVLALAEEVGDQVSTGPSVVTGAGAAVVDVCGEERRVGLGSLSSTSLNTVIKSQVWVRS